jgi:uncharacterized protein YhaN
MLLDDPFVNFDADRRDEAMELLMAMAMQRQIILLSHDPTYTRWVEPSLSLREHDHVAWTGRELAAAS